MEKQTDARDVTHPIDGEEPLYKVILEGGLPALGGVGKWYMPYKRNNGDWVSGKWMPPVAGTLVPCENGYHLASRASLLYWADMGEGSSLVVCAVQWRGTSTDRHHRTGEDLQTTEKHFKRVVRQARLTSVLIGPAEWEAMARDALLLYSDLWDAYAPSTVASSSPDLPLERIPGLLRAACALTKDSSDISEVVATLSKISSRLHEYGYRHMRGRSSMQLNVDRLVLRLSDKGLIIARSMLNERDSIPWPERSCGFELYSYVADDMRGRVWDVASAVYHAALPALEVPVTEGSVIEYLGGRRQAYLEGRTPEPVVPLPVPRAMVPETNQ